MTKVDFLIPVTYMYILHTGVQFIMLPPFLCYTFSFHMHGKLLTDRLKQQLNFTRNGFKFAFELKLHGL